MGRHGGGRDDGWELAPPAGLHDVFPESTEVDHRIPDLDGREPGTPLGAPRRRSVRGWGHRAIVVLLIAAAAVIGFRVAGALHGEENAELLVPATTTAGEPTASASAGSPSADATAPALPDGDDPTTQASQLQVHVIGAVKKPGLYRLPDGARVDDAVKAAGGATGKANLAGVNLAGAVGDGTQVRVPAKGESSTVAGGSGSETLGAPQQGVQPLSVRPGTDAANTEPSIVNLNTADATALQTLPGVGPAMSQRLIEWREQHGPFTSAADLDAVPGIGPAMLAKLEGKVGYG
ncbi:MAG: helix-hairpin-helix domain-containing protein [Galactobacter sp.]|uniref:ComEA family DNA-binding protein n=1 Tax=Galactobacter sp. TaxID=2676125 RepID=UPI0025BA697D|nr:ComEA family DNA-binding protein [Galactobacter sp.]